MLQVQETLRSMEHSAVNKSTIGTGPVDSNLRQEIQSIKESNKQWLPLVESVLDEYKKENASQQEEMIQTKYHVENLTQQLRALKELYDKFQFNILSDRKVNLNQ